MIRNGIKQKRFHWLVDMINTHKYITGAEIGAATGITTTYLLDECPTLERLAIVDIWKPVAPISHPSGWGKDNMEKVFRAKFMEDPRIDIFKGLSWQMAGDVKDKILDFIFFDADHTYPGLKKDYLAWYDKVRPGGLLSGHDINLPGVLQAVEELVPGWIDSKIDHVWYKFKAI